MLARFVRVERGVDPAEDDRRATFAREAADLIAAQRVRRVDADADDIARLDRVGHERLERLVHD